MPHRKEPRGLGGIFYDYLNSKSWENDFSFTKKVGETFIDSYKHIVTKTKKENGMIKIKNFSFIEDLDTQNSIYSTTEEQNLGCKLMEI